MKTTIGGERLGSGGKAEVSMKTYNRSTHDLSSNWRSSMSAGTLVPFMNLTALPGDSFEIDLAAEVVTLPTIGPLFGSYKVQLDVFQVPMRLYNAQLTMNALNVGNNMTEIKLPQVAIKGSLEPENTAKQVESSCIHKYLGISGIGKATGLGRTATREFNAVPYLAYWDIFKNYYANKQEDNAYVIHTGSNDFTQVAFAGLNQAGTQVQDIAVGPATITINGTEQLEVGFGGDQPNSFSISLNGGPSVTAGTYFSSIVWNETTTRYICTGWQTFWGELGASVTLEITQPLAYMGEGDAGINLVPFPLENIDQMRTDLLQHPSTTAYTITDGTNAPYGLTTENIINVNQPTYYSQQYSQEGLAVKTYQSDLFNNWIQTEWIDGDNGVNEITAVQVVDGEFTIDALNLASKIYSMLNRVAISGGTYDDWLDAVYDQERSKAIHSPVYHGSLIKELAFEEVISQAETQIQGNQQPLGTLAGRGRLTGKNKGGKVNIKVDEPSVIIGIASLTPRINYSQGNQWDVNLKTFDDFHKPALDAIGYQDLVAEQLAQETTEWDNDNQEATYANVGKQPAWINYQTDVDRVYGNFAEETKDMFMILDRRFETNEQGELTDNTTYIDPTKFNNIFAQTELTAQNFWVQIRKEIKARRKMSGRSIPNL